MTNINAFGTKLYRGGTAGTAIAQVVNITGPNLKRNMLDVTNHDSTGGWPEFVAGIFNASELKLDINYDPVGATHKNAAGGLLKDFADGTAVAYALKFPDAATTTWTQNCIVSGFEPKAPTNGVLAATVTLQITGAVTTA